MSDDGERLDVLLREAASATRRAVNVARRRSADAAAICAAVEVAFAAVRKARACAIRRHVGNPPWHFARLDVTS